MELTASVATAYVRQAFDQLLAVADRVGEDAVNQRPVGPETNSVASLVVHCCGVCEFWLGHVGLGRDSQRDRDGEFTAVATLPELHDLVRATLAQVESDLVAIEAGRESPHADGRLFLAVDPGDASLVVHLVEELFQHLGHAELAADVLLAR